MSTNLGKLARLRICREEQLEYSSLLASTNTPTSTGFRQHNLWVIDGSSMRASGAGAETK